MAIVSIADALSASEKAGSDNARGLRQLWRRISGVAWKANKARAEWRSSREALRHLSRLDDHCLRDVGVDRADLPRDPVLLVIPKEWFFPDDGR